MKILTKVNFILVFSLSVSVILLLSSCQSPSSANKTKTAVVTPTIDEDLVLPSKAIAPTAKVIYKTVNDIELSLHIFNPKGHLSDDNRPAIVFFHGGGFNGGHPSQFYRQSHYLAQKGMVAISVQYRLKKIHGTSPADALKDAKAAMRYIRAHASQLGINTDKIAASGGSAGGHLASAIATNTQIDELKPEFNQSHRPNLLVLFNPVFDNGPTGWGHARVKDYWQQFSPLHNIDSNTPAAIGFFGEKDTAVTVDSANQFKQKMQQLGSSFDLHVFENQPHGFFNIVKFSETLALTEQFLIKHGFIHPEHLGNRYYIDAQSGNDNNNGLSPKQAFASLKKANQILLKPGDKLLFKKGTQYSGTFEPRGSGTEAAPIIIDSYGNAAEQPQINGWGQKQYALRLYNSAFIRLNNLKITNQGKDRKARRVGLVVEADNVGSLEHVVVNNVEVFNVNGALKKKAGGGAGILVRNHGKQTPSRFVDLRLINNHIHHTSRNGINFRGNALRSAWFPSLQVKVVNNLIEQVPGDGIVVIGTDGALIQGNVLRDFPDILPVGDAAAGIWPWSSDNTLIQFNEVSGHKAKWDGQGYDSDFNSKGTIIQYNYSHDNYGGFLLICNNGNKYGQDINKGTIDTIIRGNVSINDGIRPYPTHAGTFSPTFHITGPTEHTRIYDNIIIVPKKVATSDNTIIEMDNWGGPWPMDTLFENNQFYIEGQSQIKHKKVKSFTFKNNILNKAVDGMSPSENTILTDSEFDLDALTRMALDKLQGHKKYEVQ